MLKTVSNGQSIHQYIPPHLRRMFYNNPATVHASQNGKDPYGFPTNGLALYLPLWALKDSAFKSIDPYHHACTVTGATYGSQGRTFGGNAKITIPDNATLRLGTGSLLISIWVKPDISQSCYLLGAYSGVANGGWALWLSTDGRIYFSYRLSGISRDQSTLAAAVTTNTWQMLTWLLNKSTNEIVFYNGTTLKRTQALVEAGDLSENTTVEMGYLTYTAAYGKATIGEIIRVNGLGTVAEITQIYNATKWRY